LFFGPSKTKNEGLVIIKKNNYILQLVLILSLPTFSFASREWKVVAYFPEWSVYSGRYRAADIPAEKLTHVNYAFAKISTTGEISIWDRFAALSRRENRLPPQRSVLFAGNFQQLRMLKVRHPHLEILISIGGWTGSSEFSKIAATDKSRRRFSESVVRFLQRYKIFDGVDLDWEFPVIGGIQPGKPSDRDGLSLLLKALRAHLGSDYLITAAVSANPEVISAIDWTELTKYVDWVNLMTYDFHGPWDNVTGHNSPLYSHTGIRNKDYNVDSAVRNLRSAGVPSKMIMVGLAFYGRSYAGVNKKGIHVPSEGPGSGNWAPGAIDYKELVRKYIDHNGYIYRWDEAAKAPYLFNAKKKEFISYDDPQSIGMKIDYVVQNELGGVMCWEITGDNGDLLQAVHRGLFGARERRLKRAENDPTDPLPR
jgi:chitinase